MDSGEQMLPTVMTVKSVRDQMAICAISGANWGDIALPVEKLPAEVIRLVREGKHAVVSARANVGTSRRELLRVEGPFEFVGAAAADEERRPAGRKRQV